MRTACTVVRNGNVKSTEPVGDVDDMIHKVQKVTQLSSNNIL
jgi:hypothetical protein